MKFQYTLATDLDQAWLNFELDLPLQPGPNGESNPFYIERPENPTARLERELLRQYNQSPKYFFSGHCGCGKSTELRRLAVNPKILAQYWPIYFTIRDEADINNLDFKDVLLAIGGRLYREYHKTGGKLSKELLQELNSWRRQVETQVKTVFAGRTEKEIDIGLEAFFANVGLKLKLEPTTRSELRQVFERNLSDLIGVINKIAAMIRTHEKRPPLVLIDDLDKPDLEHSRAIFYDHRETMLQPKCPIVYTISNAHFYNPEFQAILDRTIFLPNVKLHERGELLSHDREGYQTMRMFAYKRMRPDLISDEALDAAVTMSGGMFQEMARIMRRAIGQIRIGRQTRIELAEVQKAVAAIRGEYRRFLTKEQRAVLRDLRVQNFYDEPDKVPPLLQMVAALEYSNGEPWCEVHPALNKLLDEDE